MMCDMTCMCDMTHTHFAHTDTSFNKLAPNLLQICSKDKDTLQQDIEKKRKLPQRTATTYCNNTLHLVCSESAPKIKTHCNKTLQKAHCKNILQQQTATTHCNTTLQLVCSESPPKIKTHRNNTLQQHTSTTHRNNTLNNTLQQHTATRHCNKYAPNLFFPYSPHLLLLGGFGW